MSIIKKDKFFYKETNGKRETYQMCIFSEGSRNKPSQKEIAEVKGCKQIKANQISKAVALSDHRV